MAVVALIAFMIYRWDVFGEHIKALWQGITGMISGVFAFLKGLVQIVVGIFTGDFEKIGEGFRNVFNGLKTFFLGWADVILGKIGLVTAPVKWLLEKMGILEKDSGKALAKQIEGLNAPEETKKRLLGQAAGLSPEAAANVAAGFSGMKPGFQDAKFMEALMKNEAALAPPPIDTAGAPAMDGASGAPTAAPLAGPSVAPLAAAQAARTDVAVAVVPQSEVVIKIGEEPVGRAAMRFAAHQEVRRGRGEAAYG
jgi:hypothetical protein